MFGLLAATGDPITIGTSLTGAASVINDNVNAALPVALPIGGAILAVGVGWRLFKRFAKG